MEKIRLEKISIAVGSQRAPKLDAVRAAVDSFGHLLHPNARFEIEGFEVETGVRHTPLSRSELMAGAQGRCEALKRLAERGIATPDFYAGLEGGLDVVQENGNRLAFLESWACVMDRAGHTSYGQSGAILLPEALVAEVVDRGVELSRAIEVFAGVQGVRDAQGAWGILTQNLIDRQESFRIAVISAFAPFFNPKIYEK
jgi:inosine/xanthosine triphosphatase